MTITINYRINGKKFDAEIEPTPEDIAECLIKGIDAKSGDYEEGAKHAVLEIATNFKRELQESLEDDVEFLAIVKRNHKDNAMKQWEEQQ